MLGKRDMQASVFEPTVIVLSVSEYKKGWKGGKEDCLEKEALEWGLRSWSCPGGELAG